MAEFTGMKLVVGSERRQAVLRIPQFEERVVDGCRQRVPTGIHEECVLVHTLASRENALCEHGDGTLTSESWDHVRFLDSQDLFDQYAWEG